MTKEEKIIKLTRELENDVFAMNGNPERHVTRLMAKIVELFVVVGQLTGRLADLQARVDALDKPVSVEQAVDEFAKFVGSVPPKEKPCPGT
jgi:hypothetical protein